MKSKIEILFTEQPSALHGRFRIPPAYRLLATLSNEAELESLRYDNGMLFRSRYSEGTVRRRLSCNKRGYKRCYYAWLAVDDEESGSLYVFESGEHSHTLGESADGGIDSDVILIA